MEFNTVEVAMIEEVAADTSSNQARDLSELQLALVGGGNAAVIIG